MIEELQKVFEILNLSYDENKDRQYQEYMEGILEWNEHVNLTAIKDRNCLLYTSIWKFSDDISE